jgi:anti-sigma factor RsiW
MKETQITAYALNELQGNERDDFESDLAADQKLQSELASASRVADGLAQAMNKPGQGLEPHAREKLLRAIAANQEALRAQRKVVRFAIPISLAAAASIAVLLWVTGGMTTHQPAMTAAERGSNHGLSSRFTAGISAKNDVVVSRGDGQLGSVGRTINKSESARLAQGLREDANLSLTSPAVRMKPLIWGDDLIRWGSTEGQ